jgi:hypothetical protein
MVMMRFLIMVGLVLVLGVAAREAVGLTPQPPAAEPPGPAPDAGGRKLWAGVSVSKPVFYQHNLGSGFFQLDFTVVNDGDRTVDPGIEGSTLLVNGKELKDWGFVVGNGPRGSDFKALAPGRAVRFGYAMGQYFDEPGIYRVVWKGQGFEAAAVVFRVLPAQAP